MSTFSLNIIRALPFALATLLASGQVLADKPSWAGNKDGRNQGASQKQDRDGARGEDREGRGNGRVVHFVDSHRIAVREYYGGQSASGRCPPGLAKKRNGCMPPGQTKKWDIGRPLPRDVIFYEVPQQLVIQLGVPPAGYRYVRVAADILMIAVGTAMVVDAIQDLGR